MKIRKIVENENPELGGITILLLDDTNNILKQTYIKKEKFMNPTLDNYSNKEELFSYLKDLEIKDVEKYFKEIDRIFNN
jgi:hypothetical protein